MSKVALSGNASGTGTFTIASPNSNTDRTLTLPDNTGTVVTTGSTAAVTQAMLATAVQPLGVGQTWQNVAGSRTAGVTYTNTTGRPIVVSLGQTSFTGRSIVVDGLTIATNSGDTSNAQAIVPNGSTYSTGFAVTYWLELR
jgi:hypothetical protein